MDYSLWNNISISFWHEYIQVLWVYFHCHQYSEQNHQQSFTHLSILTSMSLPDPQLSARMSHSVAYRGFWNSMSQWWQPLEEGTEREKLRLGIKKQCWWDKLLKMKRSWTKSQNYTSPHRSGTAQLPRLLCWAGALQPFTSPFILGNSMREQKPTQNTAAVICKQGSVRKCSTGMMVLVMLPLYPSLLLIHVSATPARLPGSAHTYWEGACQSIELLMHNHAQLQPRNANSTS